MNSVPAIFLLTIFLLREKNKEPLSMVLSTFALTYIIVLPLDLLITLVDPNLESQFKIEILDPFATEMYTQHFYSFDAFFRAAFLEEFLKFSVIFLYVYKSNHFNELSDGIIYGISIGLGYAVAENYDYLFNIFLEKYSIEEFIFNRWRPLCIHVLLGIIMGMFLAKSRLLKINSNILLSLSLCLPIFIHGLYNYTFESSYLYELYIDLIIFGIAILIIILSFIFLPKFETVTFNQPTPNKIYKEYFKIIFIGLIFSLILSAIFGLIL